MNRPSQTHRRVPLLRSSYFWWVLLPAGLFVGYLAFGLPHVIWSYRFSGTYSDLSSRVYHDCTWFGPYGAITRSAENGTCPIIRFFHKPDTLEWEAAR